MDYLIEALVALNILLLGWLHLRQNKMEKDIEKCVEKDAFEEIKADLKETLSILTDVRVENAKWQGLMERAVEKNSKAS